ncbi:MAG: GNAT family N-acetyltransferase [Alphaproteobacteria bacterium]|nr:GNAT family N-acetyltransferase [Alphaproteobacteria bacterium]
MDTQIRYRDAERQDVGLLLQFIRELAAYEKLAHTVEAEEGDIATNLFGDRPTAHAMIAEWEGEPAGFALWYTNFSTFVGRPGLYVEDLFVRPRFRSRGIGKGFFACLADLSMQRGYGRMEWAVLDWNAPSIGFYESLGAVALSDWTGYRLDRGRIAALVRHRPD